MPAMELLLQPLTQEAFAPYGDVITSSGRSGTRINAGTSLRVEMPEPDVLFDGGRPSLSVFRARAVSLPLQLSEMERHVFGGQSFLPLGGTPFVVVVAQGKSAPEFDSMCAFFADGTCGVTLSRGVWHHPLLALADGDFAVIERRGRDVDCEVIAIQPVCCRRSAR